MIPGTTVLAIGLRTFGRPMSLHLGMLRPKDDTVYRISVERQKIRSLFGCTDVRRFGGPRCHIKWTADALSGY